MKAKRMTAFLYLLCACCLVIGLAGCGGSSDGGVLTPPEGAVVIGDVSDDPGGGDGDGSGDDEATDETTP